MSRHIYNEGRVVGYSAYEIYVKHMLSNNPDATIPTESEWLSNMFLNESSMLLKIGANQPTDDISGLNYIDIQFPDNCDICAAGTITAYLFDGEGYISDNQGDFTTGWCTKVTSYGSLIKQQTSAGNYGDLLPNSYIPPSNDSDFLKSEYISDSINEYLKIVDGIIIQPGKWKYNANGKPNKDFSPNLSEHPRLRICFNDRIKKSFYILLTGFSKRNVINSISYTDSAVNTPSPENGDFLGPTSFPWACKVMFSIPTSFMSVSNHVIQQLSNALQAISKDGEYHIKVENGEIKVYNVDPMLSKWVEILQNIPYNQGTNEFLIHAGEVEGEISLVPHK